MAGSGGETKRVQTRSAAAVTCDCSGLKQLINELKDKLDICYETIVNQKEKIEDLTKSLSELKEKVNSDNISITPLPTYRDVLKNKVDQEHVLLVKPTGKSNISLQNELITKIKPHDLQVGVRIGKTTRMGDVVLKCDNKSSMEKVKATIENNLGENCSVAAPRKASPRLKIVGLCKEEYNNEKEVLANKIIKQNKVLANRNDVSIKVVYKYKIVKHKFDLIIEVDPVSYSAILNEGRINIGWGRCPIFEHVSVTRCYRCCKYGHLQKDCKGSVVCPLCACGHDKNACNTEDLKCINCLIAKEKYSLDINVNHAVWDRGCHCLIKIENFQRSKINYQFSS